MRLSSRPPGIPKRRGLFIAVLLFAVLIPSVQANLSCSIKQTCSSGEKDVFHLYSLTNSHAELASQSSYSNRICCGSVPGLGTSCTGTNSKVLLRLSSLTNAHAANDSYSSYTNTVCLSSSEGRIECGYSPDCSSLGSDYNCVVSMSNSTNAHLANCTGQGSYSIKICCRFNDTNPPVTAISPNGVAMTSQDVPFTLSCSDTGSSCKASYYKIVEDTQVCGQTGFIAGNSGSVTCGAGLACPKKVCFYSEDIFGNNESIHESIFRIDKMPPVTEDDSDNEWHGGDVTVTFTCTDTLAGCGSTYYCMYDDGGTPCNPVNAGPSATITCANKCQRIVKYYSKDSLGNEETPHNSNTVKIDKDLPACALGFLPSYTNSTFLNISWTASGLAPINLIGIEKNETGSWELLTTSMQTSGFYDFVGQVGRTYSFRCWANNTLGKVGYSTAVKTMIDTIKPACAMGDLPAYQSSNSFTIIWTGFDAHSGIKEFIIEQKGDDWVQIYRGSQNSDTISNAADGNYRFRCRPIDNANNMGDYSPEKSTTVDTDPPAIMEAVFNDSVFMKDNMTIKASITDSSGIADAFLYYNNTPVTPFVQDDSDPLVWNLTWIITAPNTQGMYGFTLKATDLTGKGLSEDYAFNVVYCLNGQTRKCGACASGTDTCSDGNWTGCVGENRSLVKEEVCNGLDDDCNSIIDDVKGGISISETQCRCFGRGLHGAEQEKCDGIDDDCDGQIDNGAGCCESGNTQICGMDIGICRNKKKTCDNGKWGPCQWEQGPDPSGEICDNDLDDDCDGGVDENCITCNDNDGDGYGYPASIQCASGDQEDCDDSDPDIYPGAMATCEEIKDNNCDGSTADEEAACATDTCHNGVKDGNEEDVDCGGDCPVCFVWGWLILSAGGVVILLILAFVWIHLRRQGRELTWEELKQKWNPV